MLQDIECLLAKIQPFCPRVVADLKHVGEEANTLGSYGVNAYHCRNYIAPQHRDEDATWTVSHQLRKRNCSEDEYCFAFSEWGYYLETKENCTWQAVYRSHQC